LLPVLQIEFETENYFGMFILFTSPARSIKGGLITLLAGKAWVTLVSVMQTAGKVSLGQ